MRLVIRLRKSTNRSALEKSAEGMGRKERGVSRTRLE